MCECCWGGGGQVGWGSSIFLSSIWLGAGVEKTYLVRLGRGSLRFGEWNENVRDPLPHPTPLDKNDSSLTGGVGAGEERC